MKTKQELVDDALALVSEHGVVHAMKWLATQFPDRHQLTALGPHARLTNFKTSDIALRGYEVVGYVLVNEVGEYCISAQSAVRWLKQPQYWRLMHEQDGSLFADKENN